MGGVQRGSRRGGSRSRTTTSRQPNLASTSMASQSIIEAIWMLGRKMQVSGGLRLRFRNRRRGIPRGASWRVHDPVQKKVPKGSRDANMQWARRSAFDEHLLQDQY